TDLPRAGLLRVRELLQHVLGLLQGNAGVSDALSVDGGASGHIVLTPFDQVALEHHAENPVRSLTNLLADRRGDEWLPAMVFLAVAVRAVDHDALAQPLPGEPGRHVADVRCVVV